MQCWDTATPLLKYRTRHPTWSLHFTPLSLPTTMQNKKAFDAPDADIILRALGPPGCDFRVHKLLLSLASPVFKDMFSLPQPTSDASSVADLEIVEVTDPSDALYIVLRTIYPFAPPSFDGDLDTLVECLVIADKYDIEVAKSRLRRVLAQTGTAQPLRMFAIAARFGFTNLMTSTSRNILSSVHLTGITKLPDDFDFVSATAYHQLVRHRADYLKAVVEVIEETPYKSTCSECPGGRHFAQEMFRMRLARLIMTNTPVDAEACVEAWVEAYGNNSGCEKGCVVKFICSAISRVDKGLVTRGASPLKSALKV